MQKKKENHKIILIFVLLLVIILAVIVLLGIKKKSATAEADTPNAVPATEIADGETEKWQEGVISYNGQRYQYNNNIRSYLYMGIDNDGPVEAAKDETSGGQADALFLLVVDRDTKQLSVIAIHRNTMTDVEVYDKDGTSLGTHRLQICLQHGYGDGMRTSCIRTVDAVSRLFYKLPIQGYLSLNMGGIPALNDAVGGVTVDVLQDLSDPSKHVDLKKGETVTLNGEEAYTYLRSRDTDEFDSASKRLEREIQYIESFMEQARSLGTSKALSIYNSASDYIVSNIDFAKLADEVFACEFDPSRMYTLPGEVTMGEEYEEYNLDEDALYQMIIDIFYKPVD